MPPLTELDDYEPQPDDQAEGPPPARPVADWVAVNPETRGPVLAGVGVWSAGAVLHAIGTSWYYPVAGTPLVVAIASATAAMIARRRLKVAEARDEEPGPGFTPREVAAAATAAGAWMTAEVMGGSLTHPAGWWPDPAVPAGWWLTLALAVGVWYGRRWLSGHPVMLARRAAIAEAEEWEARKAWWHAYAPGIGLHGTHLLGYAETLLGAALLIDTIGTGLRASQINTGEIEELIAEREGLPRGRIDVFVNPHERAGRLHIRIRRGDPWKHPFPHPAVRPDAEFAELVPFPAKCTEPLTIGVDPETGDALPLTAWQRGQGGKVILVVGSRGAGKALALDTPLPTPAGWTTMGEVQVGDWLLGADGKPCRVTAATPVMHDHPCYQVEFTDGTVITADADHLWLTEDKRARASARRARAGQGTQRHFPQVRTTAEIAATLKVPDGHHGPASNHRIANCRPLELPEADLPVPPYTLGAWLGDGTEGRAEISTADPEILARIEADGIQVSKVPSGTYEYRLKLARQPSGARVYGDARRKRPCVRCGSPCTGSGSGMCRPCWHLTSTLQGRLRALGVIGDKRIPTAYLRASEGQRRALLAGLLDTDGHCNKRGGVTLTLTSRRLAYDARELISGFGYSSRLSAKRVRGRSEKTSTCYIISFTPPDKVFALPRKAERQHAAKGEVALRRLITDARPVPSVPVRCIQVDNADALYLAGPTCIPTHNTVLMNCITERLTACADAVVVQVNLYKHREDARWAPACALSVLGSDKLAHARRALKWVVDEIEARSGEGDEAVITPRRDYPLIVVKIDEYPSVKADPECRKMVEKIAQACRSEAVCLIVAAQTARAEDIGARLRALIDTLVIGRFDKEAEARRAADGLRIPDLSLYGGGADGVWAVCTRDRHWLGRTFLLDSPPLIAATARARARHGVRRPPMRTPGQEWLWRQAEGSLALEPIWDDESCISGDGRALAERALAEASELQDRAMAHDDAPGPLASGDGGGGSEDGGRPAELRARIGGLIEHAAGTGGAGLSGIPADVRERMRQMSAERHRQALDEFTDVDIPPHQADALLALLCDPGGVSSRDAARVLLGGEKGRMTAFRWLQKFEVKGLAEVRGKGSKRRFYATDKGQQAYAKAAGGDTD